MATEEHQAGLVYDTIHLNVTDDGPLASVPGVDAGLTRILLPGGGEITPSTASAAAKDGGKETFVCFDETHLYSTPELRRMYATVTRNLRKRKRIAGTWYLETTTMFAPGESSVAEATFDVAQQIEAGLTRRDRLLFDHRWGDCADFADEAVLAAAIRDAYGDAAAFNDIAGIVDEFYDPRKAVNDSKRFFLNSPTSTADAWVDADLLAHVHRPDVVVAAGEVVTLGFDGSRQRARGTTDATALIGCVVASGHLFEVGVWEQPEGPAGDQWRVPVAEVNAAVERFFARFTVVGFYADPSLWDEHVATWEAVYGAKLVARATVAHPVGWWMNRSKPVVDALAKFHNAICEQELTYAGTILGRHILNARRRMSRAGLHIAKEHPDSAHKIDATIAAVLAWEARLDALAKGAGQVAPPALPLRIR
jgi:hypothetical protein